MDKLAQYRQFVQEILQEYAERRPAYGEIEMELTLDVEHDHYQLLSLGWNDLERIHGTLLHVDIRGGKIWIQYDGTEEGIANRLVDLGVPKSEIVLAFHPPYKRPYTGYATN
ncbi:MAG: XisI protein [Candidatus Viridilinea halotolerans]|uniref:XisI protein n=1 Tax=Candidatus Viridilinea halotolerans TaxID=2491704 RepID=A0A426TZJ0_9CHLR|nr:MAG: XisI protein [Candidatus Viridilinea halotolerans]